MVALSKHNVQVIYLYASTLLGSLLGFVISIVNTHFLSESDYGDVRYVQNIATLLSWFFFWGYFYAGRRLLALSTEEQQSRSIRGGLAVMLLLGVLCQVFSILMISVLHNDRVGISHLLLMSIPVCCQPLLTSYVSVINQGDNHIGRLAISRVLPGLLYVLLAYSIYSHYGTSSSMMILLHWGVYCVVLLGLIMSSRPSFSGLRSVLEKLQVENRTYGRHLYLGSLAMVATNYLAGVTLGIFNDDNVNVGYYSLALTLTTPLSYLPSIIGTAYYKQFVNEPRIPAKVFKSTLLVTLVSCLCFVIFIRFVVRFFFSESYAMVGVYASYMAIGFSIHGLGDMINHFMSSHGEGRAIRNCSYICGVFKVLGFILFVWLWNIEGALLTTVLSSCIYCVLLFFSYKKACIKT